MAKDKKIEIVTDIHKGLTTKQVNNRIKANKVNKTKKSTTKTIPQIFGTNIFTLFNVINFSLALMLVLVKSYENTIFVIVAVINLIIGIINEIRAKLVIDKLSLLVSNKVLVVRDSKEVEIDMDRIVEDDIIILNAGNQVVVDCKVLDGEIEVNESFVTGEEKTVFKQAGDNLVSGSFVISGNCHSIATKVGEESYTSKIASDVKFIKKTNSEILKTFNNIIKIVTFILIPFGLFIFIKHYYFLNLSIQDTVILTVASMDSMIPNGLILLTSTVMAVSVIKLSKYKVLVQELYSIETLARVDVICLDKTGTLTEGKMEVYDIIPYEDTSINEIEDAISNIINFTKDNNATSKALKNRFKTNNIWDGISKISFSSKRKFSGGTFKNKGTYLIGASEYLVKNKNKTLEKIVDDYSSNYRVLTLVHCDEIEDDVVPNKVKVMGFVLLQDKVRKSAKKTLNYFKEQGVSVKIISGDNITTINNIANRLELDDIKAIDMTNVKNSEIKKIVKEYNVFGRTTPEQKKIIVKELQNMGHIVAMTGDGVNDALALRQADCSIALASGSDASKDVSQLVLLDSNFDSLPEVVLEGRKSINNIENTSALFLSKTIYAIFLVVIFLFLPFSYPFSSLQLTLISMLTIGIPSFYLGLQSNKDLVKKGFFKNIIRKSLPSGLTMIISVIIIVILASYFNVSDEVISTMCVFMGETVGFILLYKVSYPFNKGRLILYISMILLFVVAVLFFNSTFDLVGINILFLFTYICLALIAIVLFNLLSKVINKLMYKKI